MKSKRKEQLEFLKIFYREVIDKKRNKYDFYLEHSQYSVPFNMIDNLYLKDLVNYCEKHYLYFAYNAMGDIVFYDNLLVKGVK